MRRIVISLPILLCLSGCAHLWIEQQTNERQSHAVIQSYVPRKQTISNFHPSTSAILLKGNQNNLIRLRELLKHSDPAVRTQAASYLGEMRQGARSATADLSYVLRHDTSPWARRSAARALGQIGGHEARQALSVGLRDRDKWVVHTTNKALASIR